jgi:C1A family cysteine protease
MDVKDISLEKHGWETSAQPITRALGLKSPTKTEMAKNMALAREFRAVRIAPTSWDWRYVASIHSEGELNFVTPIRDQLNCGSCVAFGTIAAIEATDLFKKNSPGVDLNLSEAYLFSKGGSCANGWTFKPALKAAQTNGIPDEACWPYAVGADGTHLTGSACKDWKQRVVSKGAKIAGWNQIAGGDASAKLWLSTNGPVITGMDVYDDFFSYKSGVYKHATGNLAGGHCVCIIGYNNPGMYWIVKNSWGDKWGESGFFKIGYDQAIGAAHGFYGVTFNK